MLLYKKIVAHDFRYDPRRIMNVAAHICYTVVKQIQK